MSSDQEPSDRAAEFRRALVATANLRPYVRRRPPLKLVIVAIAAFALAGALTGAAVATANKVDPDLVSAQSAAETVARGYVTTEDGTLIGRPFSAAASGTYSINVGKKPAGATVLVEGFGCLDAGSIVELFDSKKVDSFDDCSAGGAGAGTSTATGERTHTFGIRTQKGVRYGVWLSWASIPKMRDSAAQDRELADGVISRDEDLAAFNRFAGCMSALGHPLVDPTAGLVPGYSEDSKAVNDGTDNRCYLTEYRHVDATWQIEIAEGAVGAVSVRACPHPGPGTASPRRLIMNDGVLLPVLTECAWVG